MIGSLYKTGKARRYLSSQKFWAWLELISKSYNRTISKGKGKKKKKLRSLRNGHLQFRRTIKSVEAQTILSLLSFSMQTLMTKYLAQTMQFRAPTIATLIRAVKLLRGSLTLISLLRCRHDETYYFFSKYMPSLCSNLSSATRPNKKFCSCWSDLS